MTEVNKNYISDNSQRTLKILEILAGNELKGLTPGQVAKATGISPSNVTRALHNLLHFGWVELHPQIKGHWRLSVSKLTKVAMGILREVDGANAAVYDMKRYTTKL